MTDASANINAEMPQTSPHPSAGSQSSQDDQLTEQFGAVLAQLKVGNIASLALSVRQNIYTGALDTTEQMRPSRLTDVPVIGCTVNPNPLRGSFNLAYRVLFDDGVEWILRVPASGSHARFDQLAADSMTSEAFTMKFIKRNTTIPVPTVHGFDVSSENEIGCPYILMDFLKGRPLYGGWNNPNASSVKREQFRAKALQTLAAAMVQLNVFRTHRGGALRFNSAGEAVDISGAKVLDAKTWQDCADEGSLPEGDIWCRNGPTEDPSSYFLFMLNRIGNKNGGDAYSRGVRESARLFTKWALELSDKVDPSEGKFVLSHPDFDAQNILVHDDGTLSGIIDFDGVAAVPLSIGCLRYPTWLMRVPQENAPDKLARYRAMYAQFVEALVPFDPASAKTGKMGADITRMSVITGGLEVAVNYPEDTEQTVKHFYREIDRLIGDKDDIDLPDSEFLGSDIGPDVGSDLSVSRDSNADALLSSTEVGGTDSGEETERTEVEEVSSGLLGNSKGTTPERLCQKRIANLHGSSLEAFDDWKDGHDLSALGMTTREEPRIEQDSDLDLSSSSHGLAKVAPRDLKAATSPEDESENCAPDLVEKGCKELAKVLHSKAATEVELSRKVRMLKWVLGLGEKGCKEASKAFHKRDGASDHQMKGRTEPASVQIDSSAYSSTGKLAICLCNQAEILLRNLTTRIHRDSEESTPTETNIKCGQDFLKSLIDMLHATAGKRSFQKIVLIDTAHRQECNPGDASPGPETTDQKHESAGMDSEDVWACIAADVDKAGIPIDMIKEHRDAIAQCVIQNLGWEIVKQGELQLKNKKAAQKAKKVTTQTKMTNTDPLGNPDPFQRLPLDGFRPVKPNSSKTRLAETDRAPVHVSKGRVADVVDGKADIIHPLVAASVPGVEDVVSQDIKNPELGKPVSENTVCLQAWSVVPGGFNVNVVHPDPTRLYNNEFVSSESGSLLSKSEAGKQRYDMEMTLKGQKSESTSLRRVNDGAEASKLGDVGQKTSARDLVKSESVEEANQKLRTILDSFAKPCVATSSSKSPSFHAAEADGATTIPLGIPKSRTSKRGAIPSGGIHLANKKLRTILSSLQDPVVFDASLQPYICQTADDDDEQLESVAAQCQKTVKVGRWFETPRGSLKRIEDGQTGSHSVNGQEPIAEPINCFSREGRVSPEMPVVSDEDQGQEMAEVSDVQLLFPNPNKSETFIHFQVPDIDEGAESDGEDYDVERFAQNDNGEEDDELEEGELCEGGVSLMGIAREDGQGETANQISAGREASKQSSPDETVDHGNFNMEEVCIALGNGNLDPQRMRRLKAGFKMMLAEALGRI